MKGSYFKTKTYIEYFSCTRLSRLTETNFVALDLWNIKQEKIKSGY